MKKRSPLSNDEIGAIENLLHVTAHSGNQQVICPFHHDTSPSASYNVDKRLLHCFTCVQGWNEHQLWDLLIAEPKEEAKEEIEVVLPHEGEEPDGEAYFRERQLDPSVLTWHVRDGYLWLDEEERVGRNLVDDDRPRYLNMPGNKGLFWVGGEPENGEAVWVVEGVLDGVVLKSMLPNYAVAATLGSGMSDGQAYELMGRTVFICYDADHAGYKGARKAQETMREYGVNAIVLDFPASLAKDINDALISDRKLLHDWVQKQLTEYSREDDVFIERLFVQDSLPMLTISTGLPTWDNYLRGGFRPGLHIVGGESGTGKSSLITSIVKGAAREGKRCLICTYELAKVQVWARLAAELEGRSWAEIEADPRSVSAETIKTLKTMSSNIRVVAGWTIPKIKYVAKHYDLIVCDYLQRMPDPPAGGAGTEKAKVDYCVNELSNLGRDAGKIVIGVSSLNRAAYGKEASKKDLKESGNMEFVAQSIMVMKRPTGSVIVTANVIKNTRGKEGMIYLRADLATQVFVESSPIASTTQDAKQKPNKETIEERISL